MLVNVIPILPFQALAMNTRQSKQCRFNIYLLDKSFYGQGGQVGQGGPGDQGGLGGQVGPGSSSG